MLGIEIAVAAAVVTAIVVYLIGKRHARRLQHARRIHIDRFKLKQRHADIALEVFGSREVVAAVQAYAKQNNVTTEAAMKQARNYLQEIVPKFKLLPFYPFRVPIELCTIAFL